MPSGFRFIKCRYNVGIRLQCELHVWRYLSGSAVNNEVHAAFLADVKTALGAEKSTQLFQAIYSYKKTGAYESLVTTVVSLFTERDENFNLLISKSFQNVTHCSLYVILVVKCILLFLGFSMFIRPHHKKQYREMLDALIGQPVSADVSAESAVSEKHLWQGEGWCSCCLWYVFCHKISRGHRHPEESLLQTAFTSVINLSV